MPWTDHEVVVGLDLQPEGNKGLPDRPGVMSNADVAIIVGPGNKARLRIAAFTDPVPFEFGIKNPEIPINLADLQPESGVWREPIQVVSRELRIPSTNAVIPLESVPLGDLRWGSNDPTKPGFDDRNLVNGVGSVLELRIPWGMIGMADPSSKLVLRPQLNTKMTTLPIDRIGIGIVGPDNVLYPTAGYSWAGWNLPKWHERKKMGWPIVQSAFYSYLTN